MPSRKKYKKIPHKRRSNIELMAGINMKKVEALSQGVKDILKMVVHNTNILMSVVAMVEVLKDKGILQDADIEEKIIQIREERDIAKAVADSSAGDTEKSTVQSKEARADENNQSDGGQSILRSESSGGTTEVKQSSAGDKDKKRTSDNGKPPRLLSLD